MNGPHLKITKKLLKKIICRTLTQTIALMQIVLLKLMRVIQSDLRSSQIDENIRLMDCVVDKRHVEIHVLYLPVVGHVLLFE